VWDIAINSNTGSGAYTFEYDSLGQIAAATVTTFSASYNYLYAYDNQGLGNLIQKSPGSGFSVNTDNNRLNAAGFGYNLYGELESGTRNGGGFTLTYSPMGRLKHYQYDDSDDSQDQNQDYYYDGFGLRVLHNDLQKDRRTLYFYDEDHNILSEYVAETAATDSWDRSYIYFDGKSAITYETEQVPEETGGSAALPAPAITTAAIIDQPEFTWSSMGENRFYQLQITGEESAWNQSLDAVRGNRYQAPADFKYGRYRARARLLNGAWGAWKEILYIDPNARDLAGTYHLEGNARDSSYYQNHGVLNGPQPAAGKQDSGYAFDGNGQILFPDPYAFRQNGLQGTVTLWFNPEAGIGATRVLLDYDNFGLFIFPNGGMLVQDSAGSKLPVTGSAVLGQWNHLALIHGQGNAKLYLNGQLVMDGTISEPQSSDFLLGAKPGSPGYQGRIDEILFYNRALSAAEILSQSEAGKEEGN